VSGIQKFSFDYQDGVCNAATGKSVRIIYSLIAGWVWTGVAHRLLFFTRFMQVMII
jgi:hypothetical protein